MLIFRLIFIEVVVYAYFWNITAIELCLHSWLFVIQEKEIMNTKKGIINAF
jgi:hypothetical protein